jgi:sec-independent protein translocase protein TatA
MGPTELLIIALVVLLLFGGTKLPQLFRSLGRAKSEFEAGAHEASATPPPPAQPVPPPAEPLSQPVQPPPVQTGDTPT